VTKNAILCMTSILNAGKGKITNKFVKKVKNVFREKNKKTSLHDCCADAKKLNI
jgi:hypothetical protein